jgi:hypothetical protein
LLVTANVVPSSPIIANLMTEALRSSDTLVLITATRRDIPEDCILHRHRRENLKSYICYMFPLFGHHQEHTNDTILASGDLNGVMR